MEEKAATDENILRQMERLKKLDLSVVEVQILDILAYDIRAATWETATEAASSLDTLCPRLEQRKEAESYFYVIWDLMTDIATSFDVTKETQDHLIGILLALQQCAKGEIDIWGNEADRQRVWKDLPLLYIAVEASLSESFTTKDAQEWRNINRFCALLLGSGVLGLRTQAMDALRSARGLSSGVLYKGPPIMCRQRWEFWMGRFEWFAKSEDAGLGEEMRTAALEAFEIVMEVGDRIWHTL
ncbi:hypothetical protein BDP55DRAFT_723530 [Colletotrichum godetiae]|uniref:Uncharacterized protein n=1 Tax=Colletotrichum godetiae TaxID=1209918 RepID=A0AAJ0AX36_9PEZI|nr:uncharacterized protein BDP55DRAFT_723530 [Colletotrichum godetiae]KAK1699906.1 hypothetical protein BDP55DRAFT_723530 [Colletotrichum godetiae]